jgi:glycine cleavage system H protein
MKFSTSHEWIELIEGNLAIVGITNYGRMHLGDIVNIKLPSKTKVKQNQEVCVIESEKAAIDVHSPISGEIIEVNRDLENSLDKLNNSPEKEGWIFKIKIDDKSELDKLLTFEEYEKKLSK